MIDLGEGCTSFGNTKKACDVAAREQQIAMIRTCGRIVFAAPGDNPHLLYMVYFSELAGKEFMDEFYSSRVAEARKS